MSRVAATARCRVTVQEEGQVGGTALLLLEGTQEQCRRAKLLIQIRIKEKMQQEKFR